MAKTAELKVRLEPQLKRRAAAVYKNWGLNLSDAVTVFLSQSVFEVLNELMAAPEPKRKLIGFSVKERRARYSARKS